MGLELWEKLRIPFDGEIVPMEGDIPIEGDIPMEWDIPIEGDIPIVGEYPNAGAIVPLAGDICMGGSPPCIVGGSPPCIGGAERLGELTDGDMIVDWESNMRLPTELEGGLMRTGEEVRVVPSPGGFMEQQLEHGHWSGGELGIVDTCGMTGIGGVTGLSDPGVMTGAIIRPIVWGGDVLKTGTGSWNNIR